MNTKTYRNFQVTSDNRGVTTIALDVPGRPLNVLTHEVMEELEAIVHELESDKACRLVVFQSNKESGFLAGADVSVIANIESAGHALQLIERGQTLFQRIEWLSMPTVAVIHGPCLGGGSGDVAGMQVSRGAGQQLDTDWSAGNQAWIDSRLGWHTTSASSCRTDRCAVDDPDRKTSQCCRSL